MKFWKTGKIVKAISEADYLKLQRSKGRNDPGPSKPPTVVLTDSDSDGPLIPLVRKKRKMQKSSPKLGTLRINWIKLQVIQEIRMH